MFRGVNELGFTFCTGSGPIWYQPGFRSHLVLPEGHSRTKILSKDVPCFQVLHTMRMVQTYLGISTYV